VIPSGKLAIRGTSRPEGFPSLVIPSGKLAIRGGAAAKD
jgi:hypothetical protein